MSIGTAASPSTILPGGARSKLVVAVDRLPPQARLTSKVAYSHTHAHRTPGCPVTPVGRRKEPFIRNQRTATARAHERRPPSGGPQVQKIRTSRGLIERPLRAQGGGPRIPERAFSCP